MAIKFGTDGWRGIIANDFTFPNVILVATAVAKTLQKTKPNQKNILVGHDRRFLSGPFARTVANILSGHGFNVYATETFVPTPVLSWSVKNTADCAGGVMITASHNSYEWNGFKFKDSFGGSAPKELTDLFESEIRNIQREGLPIPSMEDIPSTLHSDVTVFHPFQKYCESVLQLVDTQAIKKARFRVGLDPMYGAGTAYFAQLLQKLDVEVFSIHDQEDATFGKTPPEPVEKNITELKTLVSDKRLHCGFATDGDADRLGAVDELGQAFTTQKILSTVYWHMLSQRGKKWNISRSVSTTQMVDLIAKQEGLVCTETAVGFKNIAQVMLQGKAQIGGEESGGIGLTDHVIERDGLFTGLLLLEAMATTGKSLSQLYTDLCKRFRPLEFLRADLPVGAHAMSRAMEKLSKNPPQEWVGRKVEKIQTLDGFKFYFEGAGWILIRPSGTEPVFRLYAEAESLEACKQLLQAVEQFTTG